MVVDLGADTPGIRRQLAELRDTGKPFPYPIEVVEEGKDLPYYQAAARAGAKRVWPPHPVNRGIQRRHWLNQD